MKKSSLKILLILFALIMVVSVASTKVYASSPVSPIQVTSPTTSSTATPSQAATLTTTPTPTPSTTPTTNTQSSTYQNDTNLPKTGDAEDFAIMLFVVACVVVAVIAYRKYKNFNI